ncbi:MAG TPA: FecR domain-containing protein [Polyangia bacterium]|nr:FecR domain-containing protein [Polyangia bacterium]
MMGGPPLFPKAPPRRRRPLGLLVIALVVGGGLFAAARVSRVLFERPARVPATLAGVSGGAAGPDAAGADPSIFQVVSADGQVDAYRDGRWIAIKQGDLLTRDDLVRTVPGAHAVLRLSAGGEIELREKVEIRLDRLSAAGSSVDLRHGKVVARVAAANDTLAITARETTTSTEGPAHVVVQADEHGQVSVATLKGRARFASAGKTVELPEGTETRSPRAGAPPEDPEKIPEEVLLQVVWPEGDHRADTAQISGRAGPASLVTINGAPASVGVDGRFAAAVPLREGGNRVRVEAEDLAGRRREASSNLVRRSTRPPKLAPEPAELWKKTGAKE